MLYIAKFELYHIYIYIHMYVCALYVWDCIGTSSAAEGGAKVSNTGTTQESLLVVNH